MEQSHQESPEYRSAVERASVEEFKNPFDVIDEQTRGDLICQLAEVLTPILQFIAKGRLTRTMAMRSWVWLYETRSDLIAGETIDQCAKRAGVAPQRVHTLIKEFRNVVPGFRSSRRKSDRTVASMKKTAARKRRGEK